MTKPDTDFVAACRKLGGDLLDRDGKVICDFGKGKLGLISKPEKNEFTILDNRMDNGKNITDLAPVDYIAADDGGLVVAGGKSHIRVDRERDKIKVSTEIEGSEVYGYEPEKMRDLDFSHIHRREGCPTGSLSDPKSGECIPDVKMKGDVPSSKVPLPPYSSVHWNKNSYVPFILVDDDTAMAKATIGTWINSSGSASISKEFLECRKPVDIHLEVGREYKEEREKGYVDKDVQIGNSTYDRDKIYRIAEEIFGVKIMDTTTDKPLQSELGKRMKLKGLISDKTERPLVIRGKNKVYYMLNPTEAY